MNDYPEIDREQTVRALLMEVRQSPEFRARDLMPKDWLAAERKRIEAKGIQDFQTIVSRGISNRLLVGKEIEAIEKLAPSGNAKVVIIGGKDGLPLILNSR